MSSDPTPRSDADLLARLGHDGRKGMGIKAVAHFLYNDATPTLLEQARQRVEALVEAGTLTVRRAGQSAHPIYYVARKVTKVVPSGKALIAERHAQILAVLQRGDRNLTELSTALFGHPHATGMVRARVRELLDAQQIAYTNAGTYQRLEPQDATRIQWVTPTKTTPRTPAKPASGLQAPEGYSIPQTAKLIAYLRTLNRTATVAELADTLNETLLNTLAQGR